MRSHCFFLCNLRCLCTQRHASGCMFSASGYSPHTSWMLYPNARTLHPNARTPHPDASLQHPDTHCIFAENSIRMPHFVSEFPISHPDASKQHPDTPFQKAFFFQETLIKFQFYWYIYISICIITSMHAWFKLWVHEHDQPCENKLTYKYV